MKKTTTIALVAMVLAACSGTADSDSPETDPLPTEANYGGEVDPFWKNSIVYFIMTDRFKNENPSNDFSAGRTQDGAPLRGFLGGDIRGVTAKIRDGYFSSLGVDAIWTTPVIENIHGALEDEYGKTYAYHGYWPKDWTAVDPNFGTEEDFGEFVAAAHENGIRVLVDVIVNHTGPATDVDIAWPDDWIRDGPPCKWHDYLNVTDCTLVESLPDVYTETREDVALPDFLIEKWRAEGRLDQEIAELDAYFARTGQPRAPRYYIIKWLTDWVREYGVDGFRVDTAKHVEADVWRELRLEAELALSEWRQSNPDRIRPDRPFYMVGEVMNWGLDGFQKAVDGGRAFDYGDRQVDFFNYGFDALINMGFSTHADWTEDRLFSTYSEILNSGALRGFGTLNYITSHDDQEPFDSTRERAFESATKLLLAPGAAQIYYGDEVARKLGSEGSTGDAWLRTEMDWSSIDDDDTRALLSHWQKLAVFRRKHPAVGAGIHRKLQDAPYVFSRSLDHPADKVLVATDLPAGHKRVAVHGLFADGSLLIDSYSGQELSVVDGHVELTSPFPIILLGSN